MPIVKMPDGQNVRFPDDMPKEQIRSLIIQKFPELGATVEEKETVNLNPLTEEQKAKPANDYTKGTIKAFLEGWGEGIESGFNKANSGATLGATDWLDRKTQGSPQKALQEQLQAEADAAGAGDFYKNANVLAEFGGSIYPTEKIYKGVNMFAKGTKALAGAGAIEQALKNIINSDSIDETTYNGIVGALTGSITGGSLGLAGKLAKGAWYLTKNSAQKGLSYLKEEIGEEALNGFINKAKEQGRSILEVINEKTANILHSAQRQTPEAKEIVSSRIDEIIAGSKDKADELVENFAGKTQGWENVEAVKEAADKGTKEIFDRVYAYGDISKKSPEVANFIKENDLIKSLIKEVKSDPKFQDLKKLPDGDMRVLETVRQKLSRLYKDSGIKAEKDAILNTQSKFLEKIKKAAPGYDEALSSYNTFHKIDEATDMAQQVFKGNVLPKKFAKDFDNLSDYEKDALKLGLKDELIKIIGKKKNDAGWGDLLSKNVQQKIKTVLGKENGQKLINFAKDEVKRNKILDSVSSVTSKESNKIPYIYTNTINQVSDVIARIQGIGNKSRNIGIAELLSSPQAEAMEKAIKDYGDKKLIKANKYLQEKLGKDYLPISALLGADWFNSNNKL